MEGSIEGRTVGKCNPLPQHCLSCNDTHFVCTDPQMKTSSFRSRRRRPVMSCRRAEHYWSYFG